MTNELVSVIITTYKREMRLLERTIKSVLNQTYDHLEVIIVDDNPTDNLFSADIVTGLSEYPKIRYIKQEGNQGACKARNLGIQAAQGQKIAFLDDDDEWLPEKISRQLAAFEKFPEAGLIFCTGFVRFDDQPEKGLIDYYTKDCFKEVVTYEDMLSGDFVGTTSNPLIKKACFDKSGGFQPDLPARQDYEMWLRIAKDFSIRGIDNQLFVHYMHEGEQISKNHRKSLTGFLYIYKTYKSDFKIHTSARVKILDRICEEWSQVNSTTALWPRLQRKWFKITLALGIKK